MSDFYSIRKKYQKQARKKEREYSAAAVEKAKSLPGNAVSNIASTARSGFNKAMEGARARRESEMRMAQNGITLDELGRYGEASLEQTAGGARTVLSPVSGPVEAVTPDLGVTDALMSTSGGQALQRLAKENPRTTKNLANLAEGASWFPGMKFIGRAANALVDNMPTKIPGFYDSPNPINKAIATGKVALPATLGMFEQLFSPRSMAERRIIGTGWGRRAEYAGSTEQGVSMGNMLASSHMDKQASRSPEGRDNVVQSSAENQRYVQDSFDISDTERLRENLKSLEPDTPDVVLNAAENHVRRVHGTDNRAGGTTAVIRRPLSGEKLSGETIGVASTGSAVSRALTSQPTLNAARKALPDAEGVDFYRQYLTIAKHANTDNVRLAVKRGKLPDESTGANVQQLYWNALYNKNQGKKVTAKQQKALDFFNEAKTIQLTDRGNGIYTLQDTTKSAAQDLGGMNQWFAIDVNNHKGWGMGSDGHDMFGMNPAGGNDLINITPIHSFDIGTKRKYGETGEAPVDVSRIEELTGMPRNKGESATAYQKRVMKDYRGTAELRDYMESGRNLAGAGMLTTAVGGGVDENER